MSLKNTSSSEVGIFLDLKSEPVIFPHGISHVTIFFHITFLSV